MPLSGLMLLPFLVFCLCRSYAFSVFAGESVLSPSLSCVILLVLIAHMIVFDILKRIYSCDLIMVLRSIVVMIVIVMIFMIVVMFSIMTMVAVANLSWSLS